MPTNSSSPSRRAVLAASAEAGAVSFVPATIEAGDSLMATKDEIRPSRINVPDTQTKLFLPEDLDDTGRTRALEQSDRDALHAVAEWTKTFVARPHSDLGRAGPVCPFVPVAWEHKTLWFAAERSAGRNTPDVIQLVDSYKRLLLTAQQGATNAAVHVSDRGRDGPGTSIDQVVAR